FVADLGFYRRVVAALCHAVEDLADPRPNLTEFTGTEAAGRAGRSTDAETRGLHRGQRVEGDAVLVGGDQGAFESDLRIRSADALRRQIDQHQVAVGPVGDDLEAGGLQAVGERT